MSGEETPLFSIKGLRGGPTFLLNDRAPFRKVVAAVDDELARSNGFFRDTPIIVHFGARTLQRRDWSELKDTLHRADLLLHYAVAQNPASRELLHNEGLPVREKLPSPRHRDIGAPGAPKEDANGALYLRQGLRGGQKQVFDGNVLLVGDVNQGAEIIAGGDVVVMGTLRGVVHAGYPDNTGAAVIALKLVPLQLRIGPVIAIPEDGHDHSDACYPEVARIMDEQIVIEPYNRRF